MYIPLWYGKIKRRYFMRYICQICGYVYDDEKEKVYKIIEKHEEIKKVIHFNSTPVGYKYQISLTIYVDGNLSTFESHKIADDLEKEIGKKMDEIYLTVIHVNPI
jgi:divalent metal cation (Fe/Co/Zn/Cd) transporter